jgi:hypothetical protein
MPKQTFNTDFLPQNTVIEVVKTDLKGNFIGKKEMTLMEWKIMLKQSGFNYIPYQKGFSQFKK